MSGEEEKKKKLRRALKFKIYSSHKTIETLKRTTVQHNLNEHVLGVEGQLLMTFARCIEIVIIDIKLHDFPTKRHSLTTFM